MAWPMKLLSSLTTWPALGPPTWKMFSQKAASTGRILSNTACSAPTMVLSLPSSASTGVRASGASTRVAPCCAHKAAKRRVDSGSLVEVSITIRPALALDRHAVGAQQAFFHLRRAGHADHHDVAGRAIRRWPACLAPAASRSASVVAVAVDLEGEGEALGQQVFAPMPWPIMPMPINPILGVMLSPSSFSLLLVCLLVC
jgi:hypothetical protein